MISKRSAIIYVVINSSLTLLSYLEYSILVSNNYVCIILPIYTILRNFLLISFVDYGINNKKIININYIESSGRLGEFEGYVISNSIAESSLMYYFLTIVNIQRPITLSLVYFIPMSFFFEIVLDFFHYWFHRAMHLHHISFHKDHHTHIHLKSILAFYFHPIDHIISIILPFIISYYIINRFYILSLFELSMLITYKIHIEIAGHTGHRSYPAASFPQCIWLVKTLGIEAYTEDHNIHHTNPDYNFSKRFTLWDKVFGTHKDFHRSIE